MKRKTLKLGTIELTTGELHLGDPCYSINLWCVKKEKVKSGIWNCEAMLVDSDNWGKRIKRMTIIHSEYKDIKAPTNKDEYIGVLGVDSGQMGIFDYDYFKSITDGRGEPNDDFYYNEVCKTTLSDMKCGTIAGKGFVSSSGFGDGGYGAYVKRNNYDEIIAISIIFI